MSRSRTSYDEIDSPVRMRADAAAAGRALGLASTSRHDPDDSSREVAKGEITVHEAAARIAHALGLSLD